MSSVHMRMLLLVVMHDHGPLHLGWALCLHLGHVGTFVLHDAAAITPVMPRRATGLAVDRSLQPAEDDIERGGLYFAAGLKIAKELVI